MRRFNAHIKAYNNRQRLADERMWTNGIYTQSAVSTAIEHNFAGKKAKSKYIEKPLLETAAEKNGEPAFGMTQEEYEERELRKMLFNEKLWQMNDARRGLPQTKIKKEAVTDE